MKTAIITLLMAIFLVRVDGEENQLFKFVAEEKLDQMIKDVGGLLLILGTDAQADQVMMQAQEAWLKQTGNAADNAKALDKIRSINRQDHPPTISLYGLTALTPKCMIFRYSYILDSGPVVISVMTYQAADPSPKIGQIWATSDPDSIIKIDHACQYISYLATLQINHRKPETVP